MPSPKPPIPPHAAESRTGDRIAKLLARAGIASRREVERMIEEGRVALNGVAFTTPATILRTLSGVTVDGEPVQPPEAARLFLYHKPPGLLVTERDPAGRPIIYDKLPPDLPRLVPVGRLDMNTEGLLLMTTDGGLKRTLELPASGVERAYRARAYGTVTQAQLEELIEGVEIEGVRYGSIDANIERRTGANVWIEMILTEGKNREVRRVLEHLGLQVSRLIRTRYGPFVLGDLAPGQIGEVKQNEVAEFQKELARGKPAGPAERANIGISADAGAGAGIGGRGKPAPAASAPPAARSTPPLPGFVPRPARAKPERIRPTASQQRGDSADPWTRPEYGARTPGRAPTPRPARRENARDRREDAGASNAQHARAARPPRDGEATASRSGSGGQRRADQPGPSRPARASRPPQGDDVPRSSSDKRAARSAGGRPGADPRAPRERPSGPPRPGKGPAGGRGHPPRAPRGGRK